MEMIGGYRIVRRLGAGSRSEVYLGHSEAAGGRAAEVVAIKVFRTGVPEESINREISALSRLAHPHVVRLIDLATGPDDTACLVLQRAAQGGLPGLMADRRMLEPGEAVTILAPLVAAVDAMHRQGVVHGNVAPRAIFFDDCGSPMLASFGRAVCFAASGVGTSEAALDDNQGVAADRAGVFALVSALMGRLSRASSERDGFTAWFGEQVPGRVSLPELERRLFELADPTAVAFPDLSPGEKGVVAVPSRLGPATAVAPDASEPARAAPELPWLSSLPPDIVAWLSRQRVAVAKGVRPQVSAVRSNLASVRRRVWVFGGVGLTAIMTAMVVAGLPVQDPSAVTAHREAASPTTTPPVPVVPAAVDGDDPLPAARELLRLRARCLADLSILCLEAVHAPDSAAWRGDAARIQSVQDGGELTPDPFGADAGVHVVDRMGQTVLLAVAAADVPAGAASEPSTTNATASALMIRTEAGWRLRSLLAGLHEPAG